MSRRARAGPVRYVRPHGSQDPEPASTGAQPMEGITQIMGFLDEIKDGLGFDSPEEKAKKQAEEAAKDAAEARKHAEEVAAKTRDEAAKAQRAAEDAEKRAHEAAQKAGTAPAPAPPVAPAPAPVPEPTVAPAPDYTHSVPVPEEPMNAPAEPVAAPKPKAPEAKAAPKRDKDDDEDYRVYTVKSGDTLSEIGERFGVSYQKIAKLNHIENPDLIYPGQKFKIPNH